MYLKMECMLRSDSVPSSQRIGWLILLISAEGFRVTRALLFASGDYSSMVLIPISVEGCLACSILYIRISCIHEQCKHPSTCMSYI
jgi:hypothetical protein